MPLTTGIQIPFGIQPVNPYPVDSWSGPYFANTETDAKLAANTAIPKAIRFQSMQVRLIISGVSYIYWYKDGVEDVNLVRFLSGTLITGSTYPITSSWALTSSYGGFYTNLTPVPQNLGGVEVGTTFNNVSVQNVFDILLYPYQQPSFSSFSISGQTTPLEVGDTISSGNKTFTWSTLNSSNIVANSLEIKDVTDSVVLGSGLGNDGSEVLSIPSSITKTTKNSHVWSITGTNTKSSTFSRNFTVDWYWRVYYGESALTSLTESDIESLRVNVLVGNSPATYSFLGGNYKYICYPTSYTQLTNFTDTLTLLNVAMESPTTVSVTNTFGQTTNYYVHRTTNKLGAAIDIETS